MNAPQIKYTPYSASSFRHSPKYNLLPQDYQQEFDVITAVLPFKTNSYVLNELINWDENFKDDPIFRLNFPTVAQLEPNEYELFTNMLAKNKSTKEVKAAFAQLNAVKMIREEGEVTSFLPVLDGKIINGFNHQFPRTMQAFPKAASTCHAYCSYCFRWQLFAIDDLDFSYSDPQAPVEYLKQTPEVSDILITGGDACFMRSKKMREFVQPYLEIDTVKTIRLATKALAWWPYRFTTDSDSEDLLNVLREIQDAGKHCTIMAHFSHPRELATPAVKEAVARIQSTGTIIRAQGPIVRGINDSAEIWQEMWERQIAMGMIPYYMFLESSEGLGDSAKLSLAAALDIFQKAQQKMSGLAKTIQGPVFSNGLQKILVDGVVDLGDEKKFVLKCLQSPNSEEIGKLKLIDFDEKLYDTNIPF
ncbi:MAG: lysine 2,3-aminomutase [Lentisphaeraceae bacterium]|nr:lysine 2,3-aminomutase [Lentisphaeraceae bacterium]